MPETAGSTDSYTNSRVLIGDMPFRCERLPDRFPIASAAVQLSDLLAFIVESPSSIGDSWALMNFKLKEGK